MSQDAKYRKGKEGKKADTLAENDDVFGPEEGLSLSTAGGERSRKSGPFSALVSAMVPSEADKTAMAGGEEDGAFRWDEFGFRVEEEDGPEQDSRKVLSQPFTEDPHHRLQWIAYLEFTHNQVVVEDLTWEKMAPMLKRTEKLESLVRKGVPHSLRPAVWPRLAGSVLKKQTANFTYAEALKNSVHEKPGVIKQIEKDLLRTLPTNICFATLKSTGVGKLRQILRAVAYLYPEIGYCQGMGVIVATLLLFIDEEDVFWLMVTLIEDLLPSSYFSASLLGLQADQRVLRQLVASYLPEVERALIREELELSLLSLHWFLTLFSSVLHIRVLLRLWDLLFYHGTSVMFKATLALLKGRENDLAAKGNSAEMFNLVSELPGAVADAEELIEELENVAPAVTEALVGSLRKKQLALLMSEQGMLINTDRTDETNLPKQRVMRRHMKRSQSIVEHIFKAGSGSSWMGRSRSTSSGVFSSDDHDVTNKNIHQTELLVDLKDAVMRVCRHFLTLEPSLGSDVNLAADYSGESHSRDHEVYLSGRRKGRKRARALLDFERQEEDELGFRRNDVITILSQRDEHCWVGELNGLRGWFPAKFVEVLDERGKDYSAQGDDAVTEAVTDLVRGDFASAFKAVLEHGMKRSLLGVTCHPWLFIEEVASKEVARDFESVYSRLVLCRTFRLDEDGKVLTPEELLYRSVQRVRDFESVYSRLVLCRTFRLDEDGKVLTPEELLYRSVQRVNATHDAARAMMDVKLRSLICLGLNEQALHLWWELFCASTEVGGKWYYPWSFVRSPGWVQIKCEIRLLSQFPFNLGPDRELPPLSDTASAKVAAKLAGV